MTIKPVQLTVAEDRAREKAIDFYRYIGKSEAEADRLAWVDIQKAFPRLKRANVLATGATS
jgi:hypothetical protein